MHINGLSKRGSDNCRSTVVERFRDTGLRQKCLTFESGGMFKEVPCGITSLLFLGAITSIISFDSHMILLYPIIPISGRGKSCLERLDNFS